MHRLSTLVSFLHACDYAQFDVFKRTISLLTLDPSLQLENVIWPSTISTAFAHVDVQAVYEEIALASDC